MSRVTNKTLPYLVGGLLLVGSLSYLANHPDDRVQKVCRQAQVGSSVADLNRYANEVGVSSRVIPTGTTSLVAGKTHGSYRCEIEAIDGVVRDVKFENDSG